MIQEAPPRGPLAPILISVIWAMVFFLAAWPAIATVFLFDSGTENVQLWVWFVFYGMWGFELLSMLMVPAIWIAWAATRRKSWGGTFLTVIAFFPLLALIPVGLAFFLDSN